MPTPKECRSRSGNRRAPITKKCDEHHHHDRYRNNAIGDRNPEQGLDRIDRREAGADARQRRENDRGVEGVRCQRFARETDRPFAASSLTLDSVGITRRGKISRWTDQGYIVLQMTGRSPAGVTQLFGLIELIGVSPRATRDERLAVMESLRAKLRTMLDQKPDTLPDGPDSQTKI
jgi:hypothetical protein